MTENKIHGENEVRRNSRILKEVDLEDYKDPDIEEKDWSCKNYTNVVTGNDD